MRASDRITLNSNPGPLERSNLTICSGLAVAKPDVLESLPMKICVKFQVGESLSAQSRGNAERLLGGVVDHDTDE